MIHERRLELVRRSTTAFADEIDRHDRSARIPWLWWPDAATLIGHLGGIHAWAAEIVRTGEPVPDPVDLPAPEPARDWYLDRRDELLDAFRSAPVDRPCWAFTGDDHSVAFWRRRMAFETTKHLIDLRAAGGARRAAPAELDPFLAADGVDELLSVLLARSRSTLAPLPAPIRLIATDVDRSWSVTPDWRLAPGVGAAEIRARAADLALLVWKRADPLGETDRFAIAGSTGAIEAFRDAEIHP